MNLRALTLKEFGLMVVSINFLNCLDIGLTTIGLSLGATELNPLLRDGFNIYSSIFKIITIFLIFLCLALVYSKVIKGNYKNVKIIFIAPLVVAFIFFMIVTINNLIVIFSFI